MDDNPPAEDVVHAGKGELGVLNVDDGDALLVRQYVAEIPDVSVGVARRTVVELECFYLSLSDGARRDGHLHWVEVSLHGLTSISGVAQLVDVEAVVARTEALQPSNNMDRAAWRAL